jgi:glycosyltransferase involved in cell wall biosynthesis
MRIAVLALGRYSSGGPIGLHLTRALASAHDVRVFVAREALNLDDWMGSGLACEVHGTYRSTLGATFSLIDRRAIRGLARAIGRFQPDVVLAPFIHLWLWPLLTYLRQPLVLFVHDPNPHPGIVGALWHGLDRRLARRASHVIVHSSIFVATVVDRYGVNPARVSVAPIGPLTDYREAAVSEAPGGEAGTGPRVLFFGRMEAYKGIEVLLDATPAIVRACPGAVVNLVGSGLSRRLSARARSTVGVQLDDGWASDADVPAIFSRADIVVLPYTSATQSGVIPVAAAFSLPVVASRCGGLPEQLDDGASGVLVPPGDATALAEAVVGLWENPDRALALGRSLHDAYSTDRSWESIARGVADACRTAIGAEACHP